MCDGWLADAETLFVLCSILNCVFHTAPNRLNLTTNLFLVTLTPIPRLLFVPFPLKLPISQSPPRRRGRFHRASPTAQSDFEQWLTDQDIHPSKVFADAKQVFFS